MPAAAEGPEQPAGAQSVSNSCPQEWLAPPTSDAEVEAWTSVQRKWRDVLGETCEAWVELVCGAPRCFADYAYASSQYHASLRGHAVQEVHTSAAPGETSYRAALANCRKPLGLF